MYIAVISSNQLGKVYAFTIEWSTAFQPPWNEMEKIISDITSRID